MIFRVVYTKLRDFYIELIIKNKIKKKYPTCNIGNRVEIINYKQLFLEENVSIENDVILHCGGYDWCNFTGEINIGAKSVISSKCVFWGCGAKIKIGKNFDCAPGVKIYASRTDYENIQGYPNLNPHVFGDVIIGDNVVCYTNVVISPGVRIGNGAVIGANSVVLKDVPENTLVAGSPAKNIKIINRKF